MTGQFGNTKIVIRLGDITAEEVDAIVNAANEGLWGGGGVDGAIHRAGGPDIMRECDQIRAERGGCPRGQAVITGAGRLSARYVIHAVGPYWDGAAAGECDRLLASAYTSSLSLAAERSLASIAFPSISTGVYCFPIERAAPLVLRTVRDFLRKTGAPFSEVRFVLFSEENLEVYAEAFSLVTRES